MKRLLLALALLCLPLTVHAQTGGDIETLKIRDNIHLLISPSGGNVVVSTGEDGTFLIDDQLTGRSEIVEAAAKAIHDTPISFILNTHYHFDHTGGNEHFGDQDTLIISHDNVRKRLSTDQFISYFQREMKASPQSALPIVTFSNDLTLHYNGDAAQITHVPNAHTDGDAIVYFLKGNVIAAGDTVFNFMYPFIDVEHGGSIKGMIAAHDQMLFLADDKTVILPGHGAPMSKAELQDYRDMLFAIAGRVEDALKDGKTKDEIIASKPTADFDEQVSAGIVDPDQFVGLVLESLEK